MNHLKHLSEVQNSVELSESQTQLKFSKPFLSEHLRSKRKLCTIFLCNSLSDLGGVVGVATVGVATKLKTRD